MALDQPKQVERQEDLSAELDGLSAAEVAEDVDRGLLVGSIRNFAQTMESVDGSPAHQENITLQDQEIVDQIRSKGEDIAVMHHDADWYAFKATGGDSFIVRGVKDYQADGTFDYTYPVQDQTYLQNSFLGRSESLTPTYDPGMRYWNIDEQFDN